MCLLVHLASLLWAGVGTTLHRTPQNAHPSRAACMHGGLCDQSCPSILTSELRGGAGIMAGHAGTKGPCEATAGTWVFLGGV